MRRIFMFCRTDMSSSQPTPTTPAAAQPPVHSSSVRALKNFFENHMEEQAQTALEAPVGVAELPEPVTPPERRRRSRSMPLIIPEGEAERDITEESPAPRQRSNTAKTTTKVSALVPFSKNEGKILPALNLEYKSSQTIEGKKKEKDEPKVDNRKRISPKKAASIQPTTPRGTSSASGNPIADYQELVRKKREQQLSTSPRKNQEQLSSPRKSQEQLTSPRNNHEQPPTSSKCDLASTKPTPRTFFRRAASLLSPHKPPSPPKEQPVFYPEETEPSGVKEWRDPTELSCIAGKGRKFNKALIAHLHAEMKKAPFVSAEQIDRRGFRFTEMRIDEEFKKDQDKVKSSATKFDRRNSGYADTFFGQLQTNGVLFSAILQRLLFMKEILIDYLFREGKQSSLSKLLLNDLDTLLTFANAKNAGLKEEGTKTYRLEQILDYINTFNSETKNKTHKEEAKREIQPVYDLLLQCFGNSETDRVAVIENLRKWTNYEFCKKEFSNHVKSWRTKHLRLANISAKDHWCYQLPVGLDQVRFGELLNFFVRGNVVLPTIRVKVEVLPGEGGSKKMKVKYLDLTSVLFQYDKFRTSICRKVEADPARGEAEEGTEKCSKEDLEKTRDKHSKEEAEEVADKPVKEEGKKTNDETIEVLGFVNRGISVNFKPILKHEAEEVIDWCELLKTNKTFRKIVPRTYKKTNLLPFILDFLSMTKGNLKNKSRAFITQMVQKTHDEKVAATLVDNYTDQLLEFHSYLREKFSKLLPEKKYEKFFAQMFIREIYDLGFDNTVDSFEIPEMVTAFLARKHGSIRAEPMTLAKVEQNLETLRKHFNEEEYTQFLSWFMTFYDFCDMGRAIAILEKIIVSKIKALEKGNVLQFESQDKKMRKNEKKLLLFWKSWGVVLRKIGKKYHKNKIDKTNYENFVDLLLKMNKEFTAEKDPEGLIAGVIEKFFNTKECTKQQLTFNQLDKLCSKLDSEEEIEDLIQIFKKLSEKSSEGSDPIKILTGNENFFAKNVKLSKLITLMRLSSNGAWGPGDSLCRYRFPALFGNGDERPDGISVQTHVVGKMNSNHLDIIFKRDGFETVHKRIYRTYASEDQDRENCLAETVFCFTLPNNEETRTEGRRGLLKIETHRVFDEATHEQRWLIHDALLYPLETIYSKPSSTNDKEKSG